VFGPSATNNTIALNALRLVDQLPPRSPIRQPLLHYLSKGLSCTQTTTAFEVSRSSVDRSRALTPQLLSSSPLFLRYKPNVNRVKIPEMEIDGVRSFWLDLCPVISGSKDVRLQFMTDLDAYSSFQDFLYLIYESRKFLSDTAVLSSQSKRLRRNIKAAESNIALYHVLASNPQTTSVVLYNDHLPININVLIFEYLFGIVLPYSPVSFHKFLEIRDRLKIRVSKKSYYGNWTCKVCCLLTFCWSFSVCCNFLSLVVRSQLQPCSEAKALVSSSTPLSTKTRDHLVVRQNQYKYYAYVRDWLRQTTHHLENHHVQGHQEEVQEPNFGRGLSSSVMRVLQLKDFLSPTQPTFSAVLTNFRIETPNFPLPTTPFPATSCFLVMDFTTLNLFPLIQEQEHRYATDMVIVEFNSDKTYTYWHFVCDDLLSKTGDYFFVREAMVRLIRAKKLINLLEIFSDGCSGQFKSRFRVLVCLLSLLLLSWLLLLLLLLLLFQIQLFAVFWFGCCVQSYHSLQHFRCFPRS
jgi:hypothetical protein